MNRYLQRLNSSRAYSIALFLVVAVPGVAGAQGLPGTRGGAADTSRAVDVTPASSFEQLSPGSRMIAKSLAWAQGASEFGAEPASRGTRWSLETISAARIEGRSWGEVFRQMKADGLITARTLGDVVNSYYRPVPVSTPVSASSEPPTGPGGTLNAPGITRTDSATGSSRREHEKVTP
jgi:hypothetical protein